MRLILRATAGMILALCLAWTCGGSATFTPAQELLPEQSAAKAKQVLQQVIAALGGQAYLNVRDTECDGRVAQFGTIGDLMGFTVFRDLWLLPDKNRTEYIAKGEHTILGFLLDTDGLIVTHGGALITVFSGNAGWTLDKSGVSDEPEDVIKNFDEQVKSSMNNVLRARINEPGMEVRYGGTDLIDLKEAEWIEFTDRDRQELRLGVEKSTHLPLRWIVATRNPETRERTEVKTTYTQYMAVDGIKMPLSLELSRNDHKVSQTFLTACKFNSDLAEQLFTRAALEQQAAGAGKKGNKNSKSTQ